MSKKILIKAEWIKELQRIGAQKVHYALRDLKLSHPVDYELAGRIGCINRYRCRRYLWMPKKILIKAEWIKELQRIGAQKVHYALRDLKLSYPVDYELTGRRYSLR